MASSSLLPPYFVTIVILIFLSCFSPVLCCYNSIFNFGESGSDTGNLYNPKDKTSYASHLPYGETYFHHATGRNSDGRLVIDFLAEAVGLPHFLPPFLGKANCSKHRDRFRYGANFAVVAATVLSADYFRSRGMFALSNYTLSVQLGWFKKLLPSLSTLNSDRKEFLSKSLFIVGFGGNDFNILVYERKLDQIKPMVPTVINTVGSAITELIDLGARTLLVPGNYPIGCLATLLTLFPSNSTDDYDHNGCLKSFNEFSEYYNGLLQLELDRLRKLYPFATIVYGDYYNAAMTVYNSPQSFGFGPKPLAACCGGGGPYNYNITVSCGSEMSNLCEDPSKHMSWDGVHGTEAANRAFTNILLNNSFATIAINNKCYEEGSNFY